MRSAPRYRDLITGATTYSLRRGRLGTDCDRCGVNQGYRSRLSSFGTRAEFCDACRCGPLRSIEPAFTRLREPQFPDWTGWPEMVKGTRAW